MAVTQYQIFCRYFNGDLGKSVTNQTPCEWVGKSEYNSLRLYCNDPANQAMYRDLDESLRGVNGKKVRWRRDFSLLENECYEKFERLKELSALEKKNLVVYEVSQIEPADHLYNDTNGYLKRIKINRDLAHWSTITKETNITNPKYDMIFMYDGLGQTKGPICHGRSMEEDYGQYDGQTTNNVYCLNAHEDRHQQPYIYYDNMKRVTFDIWFEHSVYASLTAAMTKANELINLLGKQNVKVGKVVPLDKYIEIV